MRLPEESLSRLFLRESLALLRLNEADVALALLFTTIGILIFLDYVVFVLFRHPCRNWGNSFKTLFATRVPSAGVRNSMARHVSMHMACPFEKLAKHECVRIGIIYRQDVEIGVS